MAIDQIMYFALGFLLAGLLALIVLPSVWKRAVRLTRKRIEQATPITMAEVRADKDQLRAEFALTHRRLERNIELLRTRLAEQLTDLNAAVSDAAVARAEHDRMYAVHSDLEERNATANNRILELERQIAGLAQQLRARDRELADLSSSKPVIAAAPAEQPQPPASGVRDSAIASIRNALGGGERETIEALDNISEAYSRISDAGNALSAIANGNEGGNGRRVSLAEKLSRDDALEDLHNKISEVESTIRSEWEDGTADKDELRDRLGDIASSASRLIYANDSDAADDAGQSLFDRIRKFAGDSLDETEVGPTAQPGRSPDRRNQPAGPSLADRIAAFAETNVNH